MPLAIVDQIAGAISDRLVLMVDNDDYEIGIIEVVKAEAMSTILEDVPEEGEEGEEGEEFVEEDLAA